jgi:uncharacterized protein YbjT (DUF2867 family)
MILVTGGTGVLGRHVVRRLSERGAEVRVLTRMKRPSLPDGVRAVRGDLATGAGLAQAAAGAEAVVHCASATKIPTYRKVAPTDVRGTRRLLEALPRSAHVVYISIVGIDRIPLGYYRAKREAEQVVTSAGLPHTILRTTQFHDLIFDVLERGSRLPVLGMFKGFRFQPVEADEVAERMVTLLDAPPGGRAEDMGGPQIRALDDLARAYLTATGKRRPLVRIPLPGKVAHGFREGHHLSPDHADGAITWEDYLRRRLPPN